MNTLCNDTHLRSQSGQTHRMLKFSLQIYIQKIEYPIFSQCNCNMQWWPRCGEQAVTPFISTICQERWVGAGTSGGWNGRVVSHALILTSKNNLSILKEHISSHKNEYFFFTYMPVIFHFQTVFHWHWDISLKNINYHPKKPGSQFKLWHLDRPLIMQAERSVGCQECPLK